jgi:hypothetical protein
MIEGHVVTEAFPAAAKSIAALTTLLLVPAEALSHGSPLNRPVRWDDWNWDPVILLNLLVISWLYGRGWLPLALRRFQGPHVLPEIGQLPRE